MGLPARLFPRAVGVVMINRARYNEAKKLLEEIRHELDTQPLTLDQRRELERHAGGLAGILLSPWLPVSWPRRLLMAAIVLLGAQQAWVGNYEALVWWLALPFLSPRIVGECSHFTGRCARFVRAYTWGGPPELT
jgi:hypothetical protein